MVAGRLGKTTRIQRVMEPRVGLLFSLLYPATWTAGNLEVDSNVDSVSREVL